jgi:hypothetical protein
MSSKAKLRGQCMCGAVQLTATANEPIVTACHCKMCRRWSSGPFFEVTCVDVVFEGADNISKIKSSEWAERAFCKKCGSNLYCQIIGSDELQIAAGVFDDPSDLRLSMQIFSDANPPYYTLADETENMTTAEVYAAYAPPAD